VRLLSRNKKLVNSAYPEIAAAIAEQPAADFVIDGEVVAFDGAVSSFAKLQPRMQVRDPHQARRSATRASRDCAATSARATW
jgi:ATP-dependent DNA ligase